MKLNLGCGYNKYPGYVNVDHDANCSPDIVADLEGRLPFDDSSVDEIIGAVRVPVARALAAAETLTDFVEMDLCLTTMSVECGLYFEQDRFGKLPRCELTVWGEWAEALRFCGP